MYLLHLQEARVPLLDRHNIQLQHRGPHQPLLTVEIRPTQGFMRQVPQAFHEGSITFVQTWDASTGKPIQECDEGRSTRALAIGIILNTTMYYMSSKHCSFAFHLAAGATAHTAWVKKLQSWNQLIRKNLQCRTSGVCNAVSWWQWQHLGNEWGLETNSGEYLALDLPPIFVTIEI